MDVSKILLVFFVIIIVLTFVSILPSRDQTGQFIMPKNNLDLGLTLILFSVGMIFIIKVPKKHYRPIPSGA